MVQVTSMMLELTLRANMCVRMTMSMSACGVRNEDLKTVPRYHAHMNETPVFVT